MNKLIALLRKIAHLLFTFLAGRQGRNPDIRINGYSRFGSRMVFGKNIHFNGVTTYGAGTVHIGSNFHSGRGLKILTQNHNHHGSSLPYSEEIVVRDVHIGDNVWVGLDVLILPGVRIGEGAIIQAGAAVARSIPPLAIAGGNPAVPFRYRDENHYFSLKAQEKFL